MALAKENAYTIADIYALPDGERAELIDGQLYMMSPPTRKHQQISMSLSYMIKDHILKNNGDCEVYTAPFAVFLNQDDTTYVEPDISVICDKDKLDENGCNGAPDWIIEIVSPGSKRMDYMVKLFKYRSAGVKEYWIVDPLKNRILVYDFKTNDLNEYTFTDKIHSNLYENLIVDLSDL